MGASEVKRLKEIEAKHPRLKWIYAHLAMETEALKERINRCYRREVFDGYFFGSLEEVREITHHWTTSYNEERPINHSETCPQHSSANNRPKPKTNASLPKTLFFQIPL